MDTIDFYAVTNYDSLQDSASGSDPDPDPTPDLFKLVGANLTLGGKLDMSFYVASANLSGTGYYAKIVRSYADDKADDVKTIPYADWKTNGDNLYFTYEGLFSL